MRPWLLALTLPMMALHPLTSVSAAVTEADFRLQKAGDLVAVCSPERGDPLLTAAINFCQGFTVGVYRTLSQEQAAMRSKLFCPSEPTPSRNQAIMDFVRWAKGNPSVMNENPADAVLHYLVERYPCRTR